MEIDLKHKLEKWITYEHRATALLRIYNMNDCHVFAKIAKLFSTQCLIVAMERGGEVVKLNTNRKHS